MGSKDLPLVSFPSKKPSPLISAKVFSKKTDILNAKYSKMKNHKVRTRNERPDIFLEGEQLARNNAAWMHQDAQYYESIRHSIRKSTPNAFVKNYQSRGRNLLARGMPLEADFEEEASCAYILNYPRRTTTTMSKLQSSSNRRIYSSERQPTISKDETTKR